MNLSKEVANGGIIFLGIGLYFLLMNVLGFADVALLRVFNVLFIFYGVNRTVLANLSQGKKDFATNASAAMKTSLVGVFLSILGLLIFSYLHGGDEYVNTLSQTFLFGGKPSVNTYCICLLFEGIASSIIVSLIVMFYWNSHYKTE
jgi:hypothetical protein